MIGSVAGKIAQASRQDPQAIAGILKDAVKNGATADEMVNAIKAGVGQLDENAANAIRQFSGSYEAMAAQDLSSAANLVKEASDKQLSNFKQKTRKLYEGIDSDPLFNEKRVGRIAGEDLYGPGRGKSINDLRDELTNAYDAIDYTKPVQGAKFDKYAEVNRIQKELDAALESLPKDNPVVQKYKDAQKFYSQNIGRFKGSYANKVLRDIGEEGGGEASIITNLAGTDGPKYLSELKNILKEDFGTVRDSIGQQIYIKMSSGGPGKFVENLEKAIRGEWEGVQPKVLQEFLPQLDSEKVQTARNALNFSEEAFSKDFKKAIETGGELHNANPESVVSWFNKGGNSYRANEAKKYLATDPELLGRSQDALLSQIISDSQVNGVVSGESFRNVSSKYDKAISGLMGERGSVKIEAIASALDQAAKDASKTSILSKLVSLGAGAVAARRTLNATGSIPFTGSSMIAGTYAANKALNYANAQAASFLLNSPKYRAAVTKPYEELTNRETKMLEENLPSIISRFSSR
ncbi:MAG: hypothetical protein WCG75_00200 [Armatimonadota bacterium]